MAIAIIGYDASTGLLREAYDRARAYAPPASHPHPRGAVHAMVLAHGLDPQLIAPVFEMAMTLEDDGPLAPAERALVNVTTSRLNQSFY